MVMNQKNLWFITNAIWKVKGTIFMDKIYTFTYGTLMKGERNHTLLKGKATFITAATVKGTLFHLPYGYPAYLNNSKENKVFGEVYEIDTQVLEDLDKLEGYNESSQSGMYLRKKIKATILNGDNMECFIYVWNEKIPENSIELDSSKWKSFQY